MNPPGTLAEKLVFSGSPRWDETRRAWNLAVDQQPFAVALPESVEDVIAVVELARRERLRVAAQCTDASRELGPMETLTPPHSCRTFARSRAGAGGRRRVTTTATASASARPRDSGVDSKAMKLDSASFEHGRSPSRDVWSSALRAQGVDDGALAQSLAECFAAERRARHRVFPDVVATLSRLRERFALGVITNIWVNRLGRSRPADRADVVEVSTLADACALLTERP